MIAQSEGAEEFLLAAGARVDLLVQPLVHLKVRHLAELFRANVAPMFLFRIVAFSQMPLQAGWIRKTLGTSATYERLFASVDERVPLEVRARRETLVANLAREWLFTRVGTKMDIELGHLREPFLADFAFVRHFARMNTKVDLELIQVNRGREANVAPVV